MCFLADLEGVVYHMNDILVFVRNQQEHDEHLKKVVQKIQNSGLTLNGSKCEFSNSSIKFLGQIIS